MLVVLLLETASQIVIKTGLGPPPACAVGLVRQRRRLRADVTPRQLLAPQRVANVEADTADFGKAVYQPAGQSHSVGLRAGVVHDSAAELIRSDLNRLISERLTEVPQNA